MAATRHDPLCRDKAIDGPLDDGELQQRREATYGCVIELGGLR
jgi:hypothetical protein